MAFMGGMGKKGILSLNIQGAAELHKHFMPFVNNGGLFVKSNKEYKLGEEVFVLVTLDEEERMPVTGKVIWVTPKGAQGSKSQGIGIQLAQNADMNVVRKQIDTILAPYGGEEIPTETM